MSLTLYDNDCPKCGSSVHTGHVIHGFTRCQKCFRVYVTKSTDKEFETEPATFLQVLTFLTSNSDSPEHFYFLEEPIMYEKSINYLVFHAAAEPHNCKTYHECFVGKCAIGDDRSEVNAPIDALVHYTNNHGTYPITLANLRHWEREYVIE